MTTQQCSDKRDEVLRRNCSGRPQSVVVQCRVHHVRKKEAYPAGVSITVQAVVCVSSMLNESPCPRSAGMAKLVLPAEGRASRQERMSLTSRSGCKRRSP